MELWYCLLSTEVNKWKSQVSYVLWYLNFSNEHWFRNREPESIPVFLSVPFRLIWSVYHIAVFLWNTYKLEKESIAYKGQLHIPFNERARPFKSFQWVIVANQDWTKLRPGIHV